MRIQEDNVDIQEDVFIQVVIHVDIDEATRGHYRHTKGHSRPVEGSCIDTIFEHEKNTM